VSENKIQIWISKEVEPEVVWWRRAAAAEGMSLSAWLRRAANRAVEIEAKQEKIRESGAI
jgi:hypothetical protein